MNAGRRKGLYVLLYCSAKQSLSHTHTMQGNRKERVVKDEMKHTPSNCLPTECLYGRIDLYCIHRENLLYAFWQVFYSVYCTKYLRTRRHFMSRRYVDRHPVTAIYSYLSWHFVSRCYVARHFVSRRYEARHFVSRRYVARHFVSRRNVARHFVSWRYVLKVDILWVDIT